MALPRPLERSRSSALLAFFYLSSVLLLCSSPAAWSQTGPWSGAERRAPALSEGTSASQDEVSNSRQNAITRAVAEVSPAVVGINVVQVRRYYPSSPFDDDPFFRQFFKNNPVEKRVKSLGSGFIISREGYILTNQHVVADATEIIVTRTGGKQYVAAKVGEDYISDVAILKIEGNDFPYVQLGDSDDVVIGEWAIALGDPFGLFDIGSKATVTVGVISATDRDFGRREDNRIMEDMIQTDAAINAGNSGGPLVNCHGEVIGINTWILSGNGTNVGVGFALPINRVKRILNDLINYGKVERRWYTGLRYEAMSLATARYLGLTSRHGVIVSEVEPKSPAARGGLQIGDVIMAINGKEVEEFDDVKGIIDGLDLKQGDTLSIRIYRGQRYLNLSIQLEYRSTSTKGRS
ncbi:MAG TPA: trypsin-like peptidase domain-containing protein [bacterium]|nr:trypsin-like peptidase domain-containing protein [bacterium]HPR86793.1 trypsin-like peptidase domain-containing protein [bacterium]